MCCPDWERVVGNPDVIHMSEKSASRTYAHRGLDYGVRGSLAGSVPRSRLRSADTRRRLQLETHALVRWRKLRTTKRLSASGLPDGPSVRIRLLDGMCVASARSANPTVALM